MPPPANEPAREIEISVVVPVFDEEESLRPLYDEIVAALEGRDFEILFVDDGSRDRSGEIMEELSASDERVRALRLARNYGQTAAMSAGLDHARGSILVPIDADRQNDPADIPLLVGRLEAGFDVVSGWRKDRQDAAFTRILPSRIANFVISRISGVRLHDYGCTLKAYRREVMDGVRLYGEMHRFIPIYASWQGARVTELPVRHRARRAGKSKYGLGRAYRVVLDLIVVKFLANYATRPIHVFGGFGLLSFVLAIAAGLVAVWLKYFAEQTATFIQTPLPLLTVLLLMVGFLSILMGLLAELVIRTYYESQGRTTYRIASGVREAEG